MRVIWSRGRRFTALAALGLVSAALYALAAFGLRFSSSERDVAGFLAVFGALFVLYAAAAFVGRGPESAPSDRTALAAILLFAVLFRGLLLFAGLPRERPLEALADDLSGRTTGYTPFLIYDNDVWRYLWDGHAAAGGVGPYAASPREIAERAEAGEEPFAALLAEELWWDVLDNVSFQGHTTVYPPLAQLLFRLSHALAPGSVFVWKLLVVVADLGTCWALALLLGALGRRREEVILWAWNPLVVKELAGSGHADGVMVGLLTLAVYLLVVRRELPGMAAYGASILAKLGPAVLVVLFLRRTRPRGWAVLAGVLALGALSLAGDAPQVLRGLAVYGRDWVFNSGPWAALAALAAAAGAERPEIWAHLVTKGAVLAAAVALPWRAAATPDGLVRAAFALVALMVLMNPAVMPWYLLWALPLAVAARCRSWALLTGLSLLSYLFYVDATERSWWLWLEYGAFAAALAVEVARAKRSSAARPLGW